MKIVRSAGCRKSLAGVFVLAILGLFATCRCSAEENRRLAFLWTSPLDMGMEEKTVDEANFAIKLVPYWDKMSRTDYLSTGKRGGLAAQKMYRFMGSGKTQWFSVQYIVVEKQEPPSAVANYVKCPMMLTGQVQLFAPPDVTYKQLNCIELPQDEDFLKKHRARAMYSCAGTVEIEGVYHRYFIVNINRGKEYWQLVKVFPVPETEEKSLKFSTFEVMTAGIYIGNFRILHEFRGNDKAMAPNIQKRNDCLMSAMENAVASNDLQKVKHLLQLGIDPNGFVSRDFSVLGHAARCYFAGKSYGYHVGVDMFRILLDHGADPNQKYGTLRDITPFWWLVESETFYGSYIRNDPEAANMMPVLRLMLEKGADPNVTCGSFGSQTAFECVVRAHQTRTKQTHLPLVKLLVEGGGKITPELLKDADEPTRAYLQSVLDGKVKVNRIVLDTKPASAPSRACQ